MVPDIVMPMDASAILGICYALETLTISGLGHVKKGTYSLFIQLIL